MQSPNAAREHERGVFLAIFVLVVTIALAVVIGGLLLVGCAVLSDAESAGAPAAPTTTVTTIAALLGDTSVTKK